MKLEINNTKEFGQLTAMWKLTHSLVTNGSKKKYKGKLENTL